MAGGEDRQDRIMVRLLGELELSRGGTPLVLPPSRKTRALFVFLLREQRVHRRERLCEVFFNVPDDPRAALRWSLSKLRAALGDDADALKGDRETVSLDPDYFTLDIDRLGDEPEPSAVKAMFEQPLAGIEWHGSDFYDNWLAAERAAVDARRRDWLVRAAESENLSAADRELCRSEAERIGEDGGEPAAPPPSGKPVEHQIHYCLAEDGTQIAYAVTGDGPPLVKAANWINHLERDWDSPLWGHLIEGISRSRMLVRYDERGSGLSQWDVERIDFDSFVEDLETVVDRVGLDRFPLLGISQGGAVSIEYAARHPEKVSQLILIGGYAAGWRQFAKPEEMAQREAVLTLVQHGWGEDNPVYRQLFSQTFYPDATGEEIAWFNDYQKQTASPESALRFLDIFSHIDVRDRLAAVQAPTLVIHSRGDQRVPMASGIELAATIPGATLVTLDSNSHVPLSREPAMARLVEAVQSFLA